MAGTRPWKRGTAAARAANSVVPEAGELGVDNDGNVVASDGVTHWGALKRLVRLDEVTSAVQQYVTSIVVTNTNLAALGAETGYQWALIDSTGRVAFGVAPDGTTQVNKLNLGAGSVSLAALSVAAQQGLMQPLAPETGYVYALVGAGGRVALTVTPDGTVSMPKFSLPDGAVTLAKLATTVQQGVMQSIPAETGLLWAVLDASGRVAISVATDGTIAMPKYASGGGVTDPGSGLGQATAAPVESGYGYAVTDSAGRVGLGIAPDGSLFGKNIHPAQVAASSAYIVNTFKDANGNRQLKSTARSTGVTIALTSVGNNVAPFLTADDTVLFHTDRNGPWQSWSIPAAGGALAPLQSLIDPIYAVGDSLTAGANSTAGSSYPLQLGRIVGHRLFNDAVGGQTSTHIAARQGSVPATVTFASDTIVATTDPQTVTVNTALLNGAAGAISRTGTIAGVHGTLTGAATSTQLDQYTFTRDTAGSTVATATGGSPFVPDNLDLYRTSMFGVWVGRNDFKDVPASTIVSNAQAIVGSMRAYQKRFWVLSIPPWEGEETGAGVRNLLNTANAGLAAAFGINFIDGALALRDTAQMTAIGLTPTANDITDISNGITPRQLRTNLTDGVTIDPGHLNDYGYQIIARQVAAYLTAKGWLI